MRKQQCFNQLHLFCQTQRASLSLNLLNLAGGKPLLPVQLSNQIMSEALFQNIPKSPPTKACSSC